jgi:glucose/arabinose dehydrogenase
MKSAFITVSLCAAVALAWPAFAQRDAVEIVGHVNKPSKLQPSEAQIKRLTVPDGFDVSVFARDLGNPRIIAVAGNGLVYVTRRETGDVLMLRDENGDGKADEQVVVASRPDMHGIAIDGTRMYLATVNDVYVTEINADGTLQELSRIIDDLPEAGQHPNRTLAIGPEGMLYITVGSTCNACGESNPENATVLRASPDGSSRTIFASGLRNTIGFDWHPETGELWAMDHGIDWLGDNEQQEELNLIEEGRQYGWPYIYADGKENPQDEPPGEMTMATWREMSDEPALMYTPHAAPMQLVFYDGDSFAENYRGDAFVTFRGSWNRAEPSGYEVARVAFENGKPGSFEPFLTGFLQEQEGGGFGYLGRPVGLAVTPDGALLVADDSNGVIYRVAASGATASSSGEPTLGTPTPV